MEGWNKWIGKKVFLILKNNRVYQGEIIDIDESSSPLIFITIKDKFGKEVLILKDEIQVFQEEE